MVLEVHCKKSKDERVGGKERMNNEWERKVRMNHQCDGCDTGAKRNVLL